MLLEHMHKKVEIIRTKIKGGCQSGRKVVAHNSKSDLPLAWTASEIIDLNLTNSCNKITLPGLQTVTYHHFKKLLK